jgi:protein subunit release factor A
MKLVKFHKVVEDLEKLKDRYRELKGLIADQVNDDQISEAKENFAELQSLTVSIKQMENLSVQIPTNDEHVTVSDVEYKIQERMEKLENQFGSEHRLNELSLLQGWLLCGDDY